MWDTRDRTCRMAIRACANHRCYDISNPPPTPGILEITSKMAEKHTISVIGLLKDVEFHMAKGAAEVLLDI